MVNNPYQPQMTAYTPGYNAYSINPYASMQRLQEQQLTHQSQQPNLQNQAEINGKIVASVEQIAPNDVPMDGSVAFFPRNDMSEIYAKQWGADGSIKTVVYKPYTEPKGIQEVNVSSDNEKMKFDLSDESIEVFLNKFNEISEKIGQLEQRFDKTLASQRKTSRTQSKESE